MSSLRGRSLHHMALPSGHWQLLGLDHPWREEVHSAMVVSLGAALGLPGMFQSYCHHKISISRHTGRNPHF